MEAEEKYLWYEEDGREVEMCKYKGVEIWYNLYYENEYTVGDWWYSTLEKAKEAIDKEKYNL